MPGSSEQPRSIRLATQRNGTFTGAGGIPAAIAEQVLAALEALPVYGLRGSARVGAVVTALR